MLSRGRLFLVGLLAAGCGDDGDQRAPADGAADISADRDGGPNEDAPEAGNDVLVEDAPDGNDVLLEDASETGSDARFEDASDSGSEQDGALVDASLDGQHDASAEDGDAGDVTPDAGGNCSVDGGTCPKGLVCSNGPSGPSCVCPLGTLDVRGDASLCVLKSVDVFASQRSVVLGLYPRTCILRTDHTPYCWGGTYSLPPAEAFKQIDHFCGVRTNGTLACWGGTPVTEPNSLFTQVASNYEVMSALRANGKIAAWGQYARLGTPDSEANR